MNQQSSSLDGLNFCAASFYGWVIVAACTLMIFLTFGLMYSYSVFFKPLANYFQWDRATLSSIYSIFVITRGAAAIGTGWLADRYGTRKVMVFCSLMMGTGFILSSRITSLWQFFLTYAVIEAIGMSGIFGISTTLVSRWFTKNRGLALGIVASGSGAGTMIIIPGAERLVNAVGWSQAYVIIGTVTGVLMILAASLLRNASVSPPIVRNNEEYPSRIGSGLPPSFSVGEALRDHRMFLIMASFILFFFGTHIIMVHLVNYATDIGTEPLIAATFVSIIGAVSIAGRLLTGIVAEKIGLYRSMILTCFFLMLSFVLLLFTTAPWSFYLFAVIFSVPYGGEVTLVPLVIGRYFGTKAMATLMGITVFITGLGGALGPWIAGKIYDITGSYGKVFITGAAAALTSMFVVFLLKQQDSRNNHTVVK